MIIVTVANNIVNSTDCFKNKMQVELVKKPNDLVLKHRIDDRYACNTDYTGVKNLCVWYSRSAFVGFSALIETKRDKLSQAHKMSKQACQLDRRTG